MQMISLAEPVEKKGLEYSKVISHDVTCLKVLTTMFFGIQLNESTIICP